MLIVILHILLALMAIIELNQLILLSLKQWLTFVAQLRKLNVNIVYYILQIFPVHEVIDLAYHIL